MQFGVTFVKACVHARSQTTGGCTSELVLQSLIEGGMVDATAAVLILRSDRVLLQLVELDWFVNQGGNNLRGQGTGVLLRVPSTVDLQQWAESDPKAPLLLLHVQSLQRVFRDGKGLPQYPAVCEVRRVETKALPVLIFQPLVILYCPAGSRSMCTGCKKPNHETGCYYVEAECVSSVEN
jgi:hypothetical protein